MQLIDTTAALARSRILAWQGDARALLMGFVTTPAGVKTSGIAGFARALRDLRIQTSFEAAPSDGDELRDVVSSVIDDAERAAGAELSVQSHASLMDVAEAGIEATLAQIRDALRIDEQTVLGALRSYLLRNTYAPARGLPVVSFTHRSRSGARWDTARFVLMTVRKLLVDTYTHAFLLTLKDAGVDVAQVLSEGQWIKFSITGKTPGMPALAAVEHLIHPNLQQMVERG